MVAFIILFTFKVKLPKFLKDLDLDSWNVYNYIKSDFYQYIIFFYNGNSILSFPLLIDQTKILTDFSQRLYRDTTSLTLSFILKTSFLCPTLTYPGEYATTKSHLYNL